VSALAYPAGLVLLLLCLRFALTGAGAIRLAKISSLLMMSILLLASNPKIARYLAFQLESQYPQQMLEDIARHDAIIVLGGGLRLPLPPAQHTQLAAGADRLWYAARLFQAGKAATIVISGGNVYAQPGYSGEATYAAELLQEWGVPGAAILVEASSRTTRENKANTALFLLDNDIKSALLVTSALHMPRAHRLFSQMPIPITPASADVLIRNQRSPEVLQWIPSAAAFYLSTVALHEYYGIWFSEFQAFIDKL